MSSTISWWSQGLWLGTEILCQQLSELVSKGLWSDKNYVFGSHSSAISLHLTLILVATTTMCYLLRPLRMPFIAQIFAGVIMGSLMSRMDAVSTDKLFPPPVSYILRSVSFMGFTLHAFMLGVETNRDAIKNIGKKSIAIGVSSLLTSLAFSYAAFASIQKTVHSKVRTEGLVSLSMFNSTTFFMVTCSHLNDLGLSNSDLGRLASSTAMVLDVSGMIASFVIFNIIIPFVVKGNYIWRPLTVVTYYLALFFLFRPLVIYIINRTPEGRPMRQTHFLMILVVVLVISFCAEIVDERFSTFLFAFSLPEEPLASVLSERLDAITSGVFFPIFCAERGMNTNVFSLTQMSYPDEFILFSGYVGKLIGTLVSSRLAGDIFPQALALALILASKGLLDIASLGIWRNRNIIDEEQYTLSILHILILTGALLPLIRFFYIPSRQYSSIKRRNVIDARANGCLQTLACIYKEDNTPGVVRLLEICHPTRSNPISVVALQLLQLTGRCSMPIMAQLHQLTSSSAFKSNLARCNHIVNAFLHLERETKCYTRLQHYIAMAPFETMHNDICKLAYDKSVSLVILPFHARWGSDGTMQDSSLSIREVNKAVLERSPCSVGVILDRGFGSQIRISDNEVYTITMLFIGGQDDHEALAYSRVFANHPNVRLVVVWLKGPNESEDLMGLDSEIMRQFRINCRENERISFREVIVNDGAETTKVLVSMKDVVDLVIVGKNHDPNVSPLFGLLINGWMEFPELGILGDVLASSDFGFSLLVVQQEPQTHSNIDMEDL